MAISTFKDSCKTGAQAVALVTSWLLSTPAVSSITNVENNRLFQNQDVDIITVSREGITHKLEVKGDSYDSGNLFFETISNTSKNTSGCFLYTEADWLCYVTLPTKTLYVIPVKKTRAWFLKNINSFKEVKTFTAVGNSKYQTVGRLVPIKELQKACPLKEVHLS